MRGCFWPRRIASRRALSGRRPRPRLGRGSAPAREQDPHRRRRRCWPTSAGGSPPSTRPASSASSTSSATTPSPRREEASRATAPARRPGPPALQEAARHEDPEVRARAAACLRRIDREDVGATVLGAAVRVVGCRSPPGATALLLEPPARPRGRAARRPQLRPGPRRPRRPRRQGRPRPRQGPLERPRLAAAGRRRRPLPGGAARPTARDAQAPRRPRPGVRLAAALGPGRPAPEGGGRRR